MARKNKTGKKNRYTQLLEAIFFSHYSPGKTEFEFHREEIQRHAADLGMELPKNIGDIIYSFRYRTEIPERIKKCAPPGTKWVILPAGRAKYRFAATTAEVAITPNEILAEVKVPDATPGIIAKYALSDEQALLAKLRYNRLIDIFTRVTCYSLQNHLRSSVPGLGQIETDEVYVGVDRQGVHYVFPVQAKGGKDRLSVVQIAQDIALCRHRFSGLICRPIGAQFMTESVIALFEFAETEAGPRIALEKHYRLVPPEEVTPQDLKRYLTQELELE